MLQATYILFITRKLIWGIMCSLIPHKAWSVKTLTETIEVLVNKSLELATCVNEMNKLCTGAEYNDPENLL